MIVVPPSFFQGRRLRPCFNGVDAPEGRGREGRGRGRGEEGEGEKGEEREERDGTPPGKILATGLESGRLQ